MYEKPSNPEDEGAGYGFKSAGIKEKNVYFYHSDHLGSTTYITDRDGNATQFVSYKPYGEALVDDHSTSFEMPWKFNGKEFDSETGLYYYGARYYEAELALWYGVDALTERYPSVSGYVYCVGNPVRLVDVDGRKILFSCNTTDRQKILYNKTISIAQSSQLFSKLYSKLEESPVEYAIVFGVTTISTNGEVDALFNPPNNSIVINDNLLTIKEGVITEELFHALQFENNECCNREFEAKVFVYASEFAKSKSSPGMDEFYSYLENNMFNDSEGRALTPTIVNTDEFIQKYKFAEKSYAEYNAENKIGNINYWKQSNCAPELLIKIVNETYK